MNFKLAFLSVLLLSACNSLPLYQEKDQSHDVPAATAAARPDMQTIYMADAYEIAATRITNKMLDDTADIYESKPTPKLYIKQIVKTSESLPDGLYGAQRTIKEIVSGSGTFVVTDKQEDADFVLDSSVNELEAGNMPAIQFKMGVNDKNDKPLKAWSIVIKQMPEDKSWW